MVRQKALMESLSSNLNDFLKKINKNLSLPGKKFLRDAIIGLLRAGSPIVCRMARHLPNQRAKFVSRLDRLDEHLIKDSMFDTEVKEALPQLWLPYVTDDTAVIVDLSDLSKPSAKTMDYLATVRDGSTGKLVSGYWLVEVYVSPSRRNPVPVLLEPFSHEEPYSVGQNPVVIKAVRKIFKLTDSRGVLVADRGFDSGVMFEDWLDNKYRFVVRLVGKRHLLLPMGGLKQNDENQWVAVEARQLAEQTPTPYRFYKLVKRKGKPSLRISQIGWVHVRLPGREENLMMVVSRLAGSDRPLMLLTSVSVENVKDAKRILRYYIRRWECEEAIRFLKSRVHLEKIRTFRWRAIRRLVLLAVLVMNYLCWLVETHQDFAYRLIAFGQPPPGRADFVLYRLLTGVTEAIDACFWLRRSLLEAPS